MNTFAYTHTKYLMSIYLFSVSAEVTGVSWSLTLQNLLAACCGDQKIRIINYDTRVTCIVLEGHNDRTFNCAWSPLDPCCLASTSDDNTVRIWHINLETVDAAVNPQIVKPTKTLYGHTNRSRGVCWSYEDANSLITGSWDSTIRCVKREDFIIIIVASMKL